jgi:serine/threonine-protein phosphatase 2A regulatory subunit B'
MFSEVSGDKTPVLMRKLKLCSVVFDFSEGSGLESEKEVQIVSVYPPQHRSLLLILRSSACTYSTSLNTSTRSKPHFPNQFYRRSVPAAFLCSFCAIKHAAQVIAMASENMFRPLPCRPADAPFDPDEDEPLLEPSWSHLHIVYEFFLRFVTSPSLDCRVARKYVDPVFLTRFLELFNSEDVRERDYLKTTLHRVYGKFMPHRGFIRKAIANSFSHFVYVTERHNGVAELLEILGSIINGFALPLKQEHKQFLQQTLLPLHKPGNLNAYNQQLSYCISQYMEKEPALSSTIILGLLKYWPITNCSKEVIFLTELEALLDITPPDSFAVVVQPLFRTLARCVGSPHFQVAERTLFLWHNQYIVQLINGRRQEILPIIAPALIACSRSHWNQAVLSLVQNVIRLLQEADQQLWSRAVDLSSITEEKRDDKVKKRSSNWSKLADA